MKKNEISGLTRILDLWSGRQTASYQIDGEPVLSMTISTGVAGDSATVSSVVNAAPRILKAPPESLLNATGDNLDPEKIVPMDKAPAYI